MKRLILRGTECYEIDLQCKEERCKEKQKQEQREQQEQSKKRT